MDSHPETKGVDLLEFLTRPLFAHLATLDKDGPHETPIWFLWEDGCVWFIGNRKVDNFQHRILGEPRCAIGIIDFNPATGMVHHVGLRGTATIEPFDRERGRKLLARYLGEDESRWPARFLNMLDSADSLLVRFDPETAITSDQSYSLA